ncbi:MAG: aquaporin [Acidimicrobiia bacterium]
MPSDARILLAEFVGTFVLMMGGPGSAILAADRIGTLGVALAFGFSLLIMAYVIGPVSGCHINPAVTLAMALAKRVKLGLVPFYVVGQLLGALFGGLVIYAIANGNNAFDATNNFAQNGWGDKLGTNPYGVGAVALVEIALTALLVFVVLTTTNKDFSAAVSGLSVGLTLTLIHLISIPVDNTSVNPARSIGAAAFAGSDALGQLWAFIVFPLVGSLLGLMLWLGVHEARLEDTLLANDGFIAVRDNADLVVFEAVDKVEDAIDAAANRIERIGD